jgi:polar amino acid transport system substrate-binding protein
MSARIMTLIVAVALAAAGCGGSSTPPPSVSIAPAPVRPAGAAEITAVPKAAQADCGDAEASLRPGPQPSPGAMPPGSTMTAIQDRGRLIVGVDQNTFMFGYRDPSSGQLEGFDIDLAREIARRIFGDPDRIDLRVVEAGQRESALRDGQVDLVVRTFSITCERKQSIDFSTTYFYAKQRILARKGSKIVSAADLSGKRVCAVSGTTSLKRVFDLKPRPTLIGVTSWTDCLLMLQQGQIDAISTDDVVLKGLARQDPDTDVVGESLGVEPYGVGVKKGNDDLVRFVNGALADIRSDGTWERLYDTWLRSLGPSPGPPTARYQDTP